MKQVKKKVNEKCVCYKISLKNFEYNFADILKAFSLKEVCTIFLVLTTILCLILDTTSTKTEKLICCSSISLFAILIGGSLILFSVNYKITVYDDYFVYQNFWRVKKNNLLQGHRDR